MGDENDRLLEQYRLAVEMADRVSARRFQTNYFFLLLHTGLTGLLQFLGGRTPSTLTTGGVVGLLVAGIVLAHYWKCLIVSQSALNSAKFRVIHELEARLPTDPFKREWDLLERGTDPTVYRPLTRLEKKIPIVFMAFYGLAAAALAARAVGWL